ncbi:MAG: thymidylate synthase [Candidatus Paceibacterota bacterium]|jgi:thymidylate synthase
MKEIVLGKWDNNPNEAEYLNALRDTFMCGDVRKTRNGYTRAIYARQVRFKMARSFPAPSTKQLAFNSMLAELVWFIDAGKDSPVPYRLSIGRLNRLMGLAEDAYNPLWSHDQQRFAAAGKAQFPGDCGVIYGSQWRNYNGEGKDQLAEVIAALKKDPFSRYHVITSWNPLKIGDMCLPPCHMKMQFFVRHSRRRDGKLYLCIAMDQRSCDMFLGVPFNIASYALLLHMVAQCVDMIPDELIITLNDCHIYSAHLKPVQTQIARDTYTAPELWLNSAITRIEDFGMNDALLMKYKHQGRIKAKLL